MKLRKPKTLGAYIPTVSMADIAFLLIIFFMLTTTIPVDRTPVQLPKSIERSGFPEGSAVIAITPEGLINVSDGKERLMAFKETMREMGLPLRAEYIKR